jgi:ribosomal subunit interface protein
MVMQFVVTGKQMDVGDALRRHTEARIEAEVTKYFGNGIEAHVVFHKEAHLVCCDLSVHVGRNILMQASEKDTDPYVAADKAVDRIAKRLRRHKSRLRDHHQNGADRKVLDAVQAQYAIISSPEEDDLAAEPGHTAEAADGQPVIIAEMTTEIAMLTVGEAVMRMDLADKPTLMFRNSAHGGLNVVYRRKDGHIGWIDPGTGARS